MINITIIAPFWFDVNTGGVSRPNTLFFNLHCRIRGRYCVWWLEEVRLVTFSYIRRIFGAQVSGRGKTPACSGSKLHTWCEDNFVEHYSWVRRTESSIESGEAAGFQNVKITVINAFPYSKLQKCREVNIFLLFIYIISSPVFFLEKPLLLLAVAIKT